MTARFDLVVLGSGGHARVLLDAVGLTHPSWAVCLLDPMYESMAGELDGAKILGADELIPELLEMNPDLRFTIGLGSVGRPEARSRLYDMASSFGLTPATIVHPRAVISALAILGPGAQVFAGAVVNPGARVGANTIVNTASVIEHDCEIGRHVHVAPNACVSGGCVIADGAHIGAGAVVIQGLRVESGAVVGAGAVVTKNVAAGQTVVGVPARPLTREGRQWTNEF